MSVFLAPELEPDPKTTRRFRRYFFLGSLRRFALFVALLGIGTAMVYFLALGFFRQADFVLRVLEIMGPLLSSILLPISLGLSVAGLAIATISSYLSDRIASAGGKAFLLSMVDDPSARLLTKLMVQMGGASVLVRPSFRLGAENHPFDLVAVSPQGVLFLRTAPDPRFDPEVSSLRTTCKHLGEESGLPLLARPRFVQLWEPSSGPDWEVFQVRDLGRLFPRNEPGASHQEIARTFRALYNLALPATLPKVPLEGPLPTTRGISVPGESPARSSNAVLTHLGKAILFLLFILAIAGAGIYALQYFDYEMAERVMAPTRAVLRRTLPVEWQKRLGVGEETTVGETGVSAFVSARVGLSERIGQPAKGVALEIGTEWQIIQIGEYAGTEWCMVRRGTRVGWLPRTALRMKHLVPKGAFLYERPDPALPPMRVAERDYPVALLLLRVIPTPSGDLTWAKVKLLDGTIAYVRDIFKGAMGRED